MSESVYVRNELIEASAELATARADIARGLRVFASAFLSIPKAPVCPMLVCAVRPNGDVQVAWPWLPAPEQIEGRPECEHDYRETTTRADRDAGCRTKLCLKCAHRRVEKKEETK